MKSSDHENNICEEYPLSFVVGQNVFLLIYFGVGFIGMLPLRLSGFSAVSVTYVLFLALMLLFVLRKHLCTHCRYYGKQCATSWGKLSALMFEKDSGNYELGVKLAKATWALATMMPVFGISAVYVISRSMYAVVFLLLFLLLTPINLALHEKACERCGMRTRCPMSMLKGE